MLSERVLFGQQFEEHHVFGYLDLAALRAWLLKQVSGKHFGPDVHPLALEGAWGRLAETKILEQLRAGSRDVGNGRAAWQTIFQEPI